MRVHQNIEIDGVDLGERASRKYSKFCNEGKWDNYINPLLPKDCTDMTFLDLGCNAGLFLRLAKEKGFRNAFGVEKSRGTCKIGERYKKSFGLDYRITNANLDDNFNYDNLPLADVTLIANLHYHMYLWPFQNLLNHLLFKTCYCIVVSAVVKRVYWRSQADAESIRRYFKYWNEVKYIEPLPLENDPHPRTLFSFLFRSNLKRVSVDKLVNPIGIPHGESLCLNSFIDKIINYKEMDLRKIRYYKKIEGLHKGTWNEQQILEFLQKKYDMLCDLRDNGLKAPILIDKHNRVLEGTHRLIMLKKLGYKSVITRLI